MGLRRFKMRKIGIISTLYGFLEHLMQAMVVLALCTIFLFGTFIGISIVIAMVYYSPQLYYLPLFYLAWRIYDKDRGERGGWKRPMLKSCSQIWRHYRNYFHMKLVKTAELSPDRNYLIGIHPHGILCFAGFGHFSTEATEFPTLFPGINARFLTLERNFKCPLYRELILALGMCSVSESSISWILSKEGVSNAAVIAIGGQAEALEAHRDSDVARIVLKPRKGFVRLALKHGASLVPCFTFGENELYSQVPNPEGSTLRKMQKKFTKYVGFASPLFWGRGVFQSKFGYLPHRKQLITVVGKPIHVDAVDSECPSQEEIDKLHAKYIEGLQEIFETYKHKLGYPYLKLKVI